MLRNQADKSLKVTKKATKDSSKRSSMKGFKDFFGSIGRKKGMTYQYCIRATLSLKVSLCSATVILSCSVMVYTS